jgi:hypothetical protein
MNDSEPDVRSYRIQLPIVAFLASDAAILPDASVSFADSGLGPDKTLASDHNSLTTFHAPELSGFIPRAWSASLNGTLQ